MAEILPILRKALSNQSINQKRKQVISYGLIYGQTN